MRELDGLGPTDRTIEKLRSLGYLSDAFLDAMSQFRMDSRYVEVGERDGRLDIRIRGPWYQTIDFEVPLLQIVNEAYYADLDSCAVRAEGERRLTEKIARIRKGIQNPEEGAHPFRIIEMGTRRAFAFDWHGHVIQRLAEEIPEALAGTSNVYWAEEFGLRLYGTFSHQGPMAMQALVPIQDSQRSWFKLWNDVYCGRLGIALSDTLGHPMFLRDYDLGIAKLYDGARQDSGDPERWGESFLAHLERLGIETRTKTAVFSDGLDDERALALWRRFGSRIRTQFGIGTFLSNHLGPKPLSNVIKLVRCDGYPVAKLSDTPEKAQSDDAEYLRYVRHLVEEVVPLRDAATGTD